MFIAAVGVWGVFKMAFYVASETGRSINADKAASSSGGSSGGSSDGSGNGIQPASPLERVWWQQQQQAGEWRLCFGHCCWRCLCGAVPAQHAGQPACLLAK